MSSHIEIFLRLKLASFKNQDIDQDFGLMESETANIIA
jgi:hypothetical protein